MQKINVMIIEDDFRIAAIHKEMIEKNKQFNVQYSCLTAKEALDCLQQTEELPQLIMLDMFIPDVEGFTLLETLQRTYPSIAVIIASAANDLETFRHAVLCGVFDYLIKPINQDRLMEAFSHFETLMTTEKEKLQQEDVDVLFRMQSPTQKQTEVATNQASLPKGIDFLTLEEVKAFLHSYTNNEVTAQTLGESIGISRSTARRYLEYLVGTDDIKASLHYGQVGRPQRIYSLCEQNEQK